MVEADQEVDGPHPGSKRCPATQARTNSPGPDPPLVVDRSQVRIQVFAKTLGVAERKGLGEFLDEEVEGVDDLEVGDQTDGDGQLAGGIGKTRRARKLPKASCCQLMKWSAGSTSSEYASIGVRECGAGRSRTTCGWTSTKRSKV